MDNNYTPKVEPNDENEEESFPSLPKEVSFKSRREFKQAKKEYKKLKKLAIKDRKDWLRILTSKKGKLNLVALNHVHNIAIDKIKEKYSR